MFILNNDNPVPLYQQLYSQIREHILAGKLPADARLPSVRQLAVELSTSRNTVEGAYQELYAEGYIYSKPRSGYFVSALDQEAAPLSLLRKPRLHSSLSTPAPSFDYDFHPARLAPESFPAPLWRKLFTIIFPPSRCWSREPWPNSWSRGTGTGISGGCAPSIKRSMTS